jgi:hypothetical protein
VERNFPTGTTVNPYTIDELLTISQSSGAVLIAPTNFIGQTGTFSTGRTIQIIRLDPNVLAWDLGNIFQHNSINENTMDQWINEIPATTPPFDFTQQIQIEFQCSLPGSFPGAQVAGIWCEAFLEQATNLGALA